VTADQPDWVPPGVDTEQANPARVYDYWLGGTHNFLADQDTGRAIMSIDPNVPETARSGRAFLGRAVRFLAGEGISQFLDVGSGIPTQGNVHEIAQQADPRARVVYADIDPIAIAHSTAILAGNENAAVINADLREPETVLGADDTRRLIDFSQPVGLVLCAVLHFVSDDDDPWRIVATLRDALPSGSYFVLGHGSVGENATTRAVTKVYNRNVAGGIRLRSRGEIMRFFDGFELVEPGLVLVPLWRPDSPGDVPDDLSKIWGYVGVARKP
jgi:hypothetical protein